jgi:2,3-bisphosphoglycerate-dependent phosphoglycerate mutase
MRGPEPVAPRAWPVAAVFLVLAWAAAGCGRAPGQAAAAADTGRVAATGPTATGLLILVRHAEAEHEPGGDPPLTLAGLDRADRLARLLRDAGLEAIHTTDYRRTRGTAAPIAAATGLDPVFYDGRDLETLAEWLLRSGGRRLIVGHSNTTPELVRFLGGDPGSEIAPDEHDRIYLIMLGGRGGLKTPTTLLRY